jgi:hypothetical protein
LTGVSNLNSIGNITITGGTAGQVLATDGAGNLSFITVSTAGLSNGTSNIAVLNNGNITFSSISNIAAGQSFTLIVNQDATGSRTLTSTMKFAGNSKTLSTAASSIDIISVFYDGTTYYASLTKGYA